jgi:hypothetical protein
MLSKCGSADVNLVKRTRVVEVPGLQSFKRNVQDFKAHNRNLAYTSHT